MRGAETPQCAACQQKDAYERYYQRPVYDYCRYFLLQERVVDHLFRDADNHIYTYTGFFCAYIFMAVANGFNVRTDGLNLLKNISLNKGFLQVMALIVAIQVLLTFVGGRVLRTTPLNAHEWGVVILFGTSIIVVDLLRKLISSR